MFFRGVADHSDLQLMEAALVLASQELGLADDDVMGRECLARSILVLHKAGQRDVERLKIYALSRFKWVTGARASSAVIPESPDPRGTGKPLR